MLCACINSIAFDFIAKRRVSSRHLTKSVFLQLPILSADIGECMCPWEEVSLQTWIASRVSTIYKDASELKLPVESVRLISDMQAAVAKAEIDACLLALFLANRQDSFDQLKIDQRLLLEAKTMHIPIIFSAFVALRDWEESRFGEYRTQRLVLEAWDRLFGGAN